MDTKKFTAKTKAIKEDQGVVQGVFATFNVIDLDGDVTLPGAFGEQPVKIAAWGHNWGTLPVGKGTIGEEGDEAVFDSQFFLDTIAGKEHFITVKNLGDLQEWSYGFNVLESETGEFEGREVRFLKRLEVFEVSPVMRGAGVGTHTTVVKSAELPFVEHGENVIADVTAFTERAKAREEFRAKEGRTLSAANRERLERLMNAARDVADDIKDLLSATEPAKGNALGLSLMIERTLHNAARVKKANREEACVTA